MKFKHFSDLYIYNMSFSLLFYQQFYISLHSSIAIGPPMPARKRPYKQMFSILIQMNNFRINNVKWAD